MADDEYTSLYKATLPQTSPSGAADNLIDAYKNYKPQSAQAEPASSGLQYLLDKAGIDPQQIKAHLVAGLMQKPGFEPQPGLANQAAYAVGKYGPVAAGATLGTLAEPGGGTAIGAGLAAGAGAAMGRSIQNLGQTVSNQVSPGSAAQKTPQQLVSEPTTDALVQGLFAGGATAVGNALKAPAAQYVSGMTGVKPNLVQRAMGNISNIFSSPSVEEAGNAIGDIASKAGLQTGTDGYKLATASMLGEKAATDEFSTATTLKMAELARQAPDALTPQEMYSTAEGLRKAMAAPKFADPHGAFSQNFRMYASQLADLENRLETLVPGYGDARSGYVNALAKEAFSNFSPINKNGSVSQLKLMAGTPQALLGAGEAYRIGKGQSGPAEMLLSAALLSPLLVGRGMQAAAGALSTQIPQLTARAGLAAGTQAALGGNQ